MRALGLALAAVLLAAASGVPAGDWAERVCAAHLTTPQPVSPKVRTQYVEECAAWLRAHSYPVSEPVKPQGGGI